MAVRDVLIGSLLNLPASNKMDAITLHMIMHYKESMDKLEKRLAKLEDANKKLVFQNNSLVNQIERIEEYAEQMEMRADVLHEVLDRFIEGSTRDVRRNLLDDFNAVARNNDIDIPNINELLFETSDTESEGYEVTMMTELFGPEE